MTTEDLVWVDVHDGIWRSHNGRYAIVRTVLPEDRPEPRAVFTVRKLDPATSEAYPGNLGHFLAERYNLRDAQQEAANDAWRSAQGATHHVPKDFPALVLDHFFWPICNGTARGALAIVREDGKVMARVLGMSRNADTYEPSTYAEIDLTALLSLDNGSTEARPRRRWQSWLMPRKRTC